MRFVSTELKGVTIVELEERRDERGFFARSFCEEEFRNAGLNPAFCQCNVSFNLKAGTLRGMHWQAEPHPEGKLVRCTQGAIYDVILDITPTSPTFKKWISIELTAANRRAVFIPGGYAHGFQTLVDSTEVFYQMTELYHSDLARGVRWNDPTFNITWPLSEMVISEKDTSYGDFA